MHHRPISFPEWKQALAQAGFSEAAEAAYRREIISLLKHCKTQHVPVTVRLAKQYVESQERMRSGPVREALRWFVREAKVAARSKEAERRDASMREPGVSVSRAENADFRARAGRIEGRRSGENHGDRDAPARRGLRPMEPKPASDDLGGSDWEQALVKTMRLRGLLWRTEYSYRSWGRRFANFIAPKTPYAAGPEEVQAFLTELATHGRASASGQRQALRALVFLMQEALSRDLGEMDFKRATPRERVPVFLTPDECRRLFAQLSGTQRLMAELAYGAGLRLMVA